LCGDDTFEAVILVTTKWGVIDYVTGHEREDQLSSEFWKPLMDEGSRIYRFSQSPASVTAIIDPLCDKYHQHEILNNLRAQQEVVDIQKRIPATAAGEKLRYTLQELLDMQMPWHSKNMDEIRKALRQLKELKLWACRCGAHFVGHTMFLY
jgi:hypothetical protein